MYCLSRRAGFPAPAIQLNRWLAIVLVLLSLSFLPLAAQETAQGTGSQEAAKPKGSGIIRGRVQNATNGANLENVVVRIAGTNQEVLTNVSGEFVFRNVPAGEVTLQASYVGEPPQTATVTVGDGVTASQDFTFRASKAVEKDGVLQLDPFKVNTERYENARAIAIASERSSVNIKNVVSTDQFGEIPSGNVGEFVKFMPGVQIDYGASNGNNQGYSENRANGVSVRGFGPEDTTILIDGLPVASTVPGNLTNQVGLDQMSINNAARVELIKVATPDMPANSVGGQVNLITRSAFELSKPAYDVSLFFNFNPEYFEFSKTVGPVNKSTYKVSPGVNFSVSYPFSRTLGLSVSGSLQEDYSQSSRAQVNWNNNWASSFNPSSFKNAAGEPASLSNPVLFRYQITDSPTITDTTSGSVRLDWKPTPNQTLRATVQYSTYETAEAQRRLDFRPTFATGANWNQYQSIGTTANSNTSMSVGTRDRIGDTINTTLTYEANLWGWKISAAGSRSASTSDFEDEQNGHYSTIDMNLNPGRVALYMGESGIPYHVETFTRGTNQPLDYTQISNWVVNDAKAFSGESHNERTISLYRVDFSRPLDFMQFLRSNPVTLSFGVRRDEEENFKSGRGTGYREVLKPGASFGTADIADDHYVGVSPGFGLPAQQWVSTYKIFELNQQKDIFVEPTDGAEAVSNYTSMVNQNKQLTETTDAWYAMLTGSFFSGRLSMVGGVRQESNARVGRTPFTDNKWNYIKNLDGTLYTNKPLGLPNGVRINNTADNLFANNATGVALRADLDAKGIPYPTTIYGPTNTDIRSVKLQKTPLREVNQKRTNDPAYSISSAYKLTQKIDLKVAYSNSFKQQALESTTTSGVLSGNNLTIEEYTEQQQLDNNGLKGQIRVANPALTPEKSDNWDFEISYYTDSGGKASVSYYTKAVEGAIMDITIDSANPAFPGTIAALGLDPADYVNWRMVTSANSASVQKTTGWEFFVSQDFGFLGSLGQRFSAFASWAMTDFPPPATLEPYDFTAPDGTVTTFPSTVVIPDIRADRFGGAGLQYSGKRLSVQIRGTYKNEAQDGSANPKIIFLPDGTDIRRIFPAETRIDVNVSYMLTKNYSLWASGRDVFNGERDTEWVHSGGQIAPYAILSDRKHFGTSWSVGIKGSW